MSKYGSYDIKGIRELEKAITEKYSGNKNGMILNQALNNGADIVVEKLKQNFGAFKNLGYSQDEIVRTKASKTVAGRKVKLGWNGPHKRYKIVHLNEFGYTRYGKRYTPGGFGVIDKTLKETEPTYLQEVAKGLKDKL